MCSSLADTPGLAGLASDATGRPVPGRAQVQSLFGQHKVFFRSLIGVTLKKASFERCFQCKDNIPIPVQYTGSIQFLKVQYLDVQRCKGDRCFVNELWCGLLILQGNRHHWLSNFWHMLWDGDEMAGF